MRALARAKGCMLLLERLATRVQEASCHDRMSKNLYLRGTVCVRNDTYVHS